MRMQTLQRHGEYQVTLSNAPLAAAEVETMVRLLGHKGEPWLADIRRRYAGRGPDFCVVAWLADQPVSHLWVGPDTSYPRFAVLGHVFTAPEHRRRGLAGVLLEAALARSDTCPDRLLVLGVDNPAAAALYERAGFRTLHGPDASGHRVMIRGAGVDDLLARRWPVESGPLRRVPFGASHYAGGILLMNTFPGAAKLPSLGITDGHDTELRLLQGMERSGHDGETLDALVDGTTDCLVGVAHANRHGCWRYLAPGPGTD